MPSDQEAATKTDAPDPAPPPEPPPDDPSTVAASAPLLAASAAVVDAVENVAIGTTSPSAGVTSSDVTPLADGAMATDAQTSSAPDSAGVAVSSHGATMPVEPALPSSVDRAGAAAVDGARAATIASADASPVLSVSSAPTAAASAPPAIAVAAWTSAASAQPRYQTDELEGAKRAQTCLLHLALLLLLRSCSLLQSCCAHCAVASVCSLCAHALATSPFVFQVRLPRACDNVRHRLPHRHPPLPHRCTRLTS
jgi:hypothetical protein